MLSVRIPFYRIFSFFLYADEHVCMCECGGKLAGGCYKQIKYENTIRQRSHAMCIQRTMNGSIMVVLVVAAHIVLLSSECGLWFVV